MFRPVESSVSFPKQEEEIARFWKKQGIYEKSLEARTGAPSFVFYEGPPTANGLPHPGHCLTRAIKDLFPRYRTMRGYLCKRKGGWDTHGLPVEVEVCKELGIHSKEEIEQYGVEPFIHRCLESVFRYTKEWEELTERLGFWIHLDEAYVTYHQSYLQSVWWALKNLFDRGLLYQGHKIVWWWAQGGTALSAGEVGQGYREVADPSVYVRFPLVDQPDTDLLVWTTTPWTLPSNQFAAVNPDLEYAFLTVQGEPRKLVVAAALIDTIENKVGKQLTVAKNCTGRALLGLRYRPPFDYFYSKLGAVIRKMYRPKEGEDWAEYPYLYATRYATLAKHEDLTRAAELAEEWLRKNPTRPIGWHIVPGEFVSTDAGTGIVHVAPAFGEVDLDVLEREKRLFGPKGDVPPLLCPVAPNGNFTDEVPDYQGRWVKDCDRNIIHDLKTRGLLFHQEQYLHDYPFCWRAEEDPLIQYPRRSWFIRTTRFKEKMLANNARINWLPGHIRDGRFGNFLQTNVDWALSRERYWGTPLPIWVCQKTGHMEAVASYEELLAKPGVAGTGVWASAKKANPDLPDDLKVHKPYIDAITYDSPKAKGARMRRVPEVIDCWFDSGAMPFAQWGYPGQKGSQQQFAEQFPADFISEALDQTRGWFYSLLAISTLLFSEEDEGEEKTPSPPTPFPQTGEGSKKSPTQAGEGSKKSPTQAGEGSDAILSRAPVPQAREGTRLPSPVCGRGVGGEGTFPQDYPHPYRNCIVLGLMLSEWWEAKSGKQLFLSEEDARETTGGKYHHKVGKMSKQLRNYRAPQEIFTAYGADALRWYFFANQAPWNSIIYSEKAIRENIPEFLLRLWNVYSFFVIYANIDGFDPAAAVGGDGGQLGPEVLAGAKGYRPPHQRGELDRWVLSELNRTAAAVVERMDAYDNFGACTRLTEFLDAVSNWYVRRSRDRFWTGRPSADKTDAHWTLYECLVCTCKLIAPFVPFVSEAMWQNLAVEAFGGRVAESVHLCDYPAGQAEVIDEELSARMALAREIVSLGRAARMGAKLKVRQPLSRVEVVLADAAHVGWLEEHAALVREELNVKQVELVQKADQYITYTVLPDLKRLGPRLGKRLPALRKLLAAADAAKLLAEMESAGKVTLELPDGPVELDSDDLQVRMQAKPGWAAAQGCSCVVVLSTELSESLVAEGIARDFVRALQETRKELGFEFTDRIDVKYCTPSEQISNAVSEFIEFIQSETLSVQLGCEPHSVEVLLGSRPDGKTREVQVSGQLVVFSVRLSPS